MKSAAQIMSRQKRPVSGNDCLCTIRSSEKRECLAKKRLTVFQAYSSRQIC